jgi:hypothetical protein
MYVTDVTVSITQASQDKLVRIGGEVKEYWLEPCLGRPRKMSLTWWHAQTSEENS